MSSALDQAFQGLRPTGWFSTIAAEVQAALRRDATLVHVGKNDTLFHYEDPGAGLLGVIEGTVLLSFPRQDGVLVPFVRFGRGYWLGDVAALSGQPGIVSIETQSDVSAVNVPAQAVRQLVEDHPGAYKAFYLLNRMNLSLALRLMSGMTAPSTNLKVALRLTVLRDFSDSEDGWMNPTRSDLAVQLGISRISVERALKRLATMGFLETRYAGIRIVDASVLGLQAP